jgi:hypothetical protein
MSDLKYKYKNKYIKYKNKYLNLQNQLGGVNDTKASIKTMPDDMLRSILGHQNTSSFNKELTQLKETDINTSLKRKLQVTTLDNLFSTGDDIVIYDQLNYKEIYLLAKLFISNISDNININNLYLDISKNILFSLNILKEALLNPNKNLFLNNSKQIKESNDTIHLYINSENDNYLDFQLNFIFFCIDIKKRKGDIILKLNLINMMVFNKSFNTIIRALKLNIPLIILKFINTNYFNDNTAKILAEALITNTKLTTLKLTSDDLTDEGANHLLNALLNNKTLTTLNGLDDSFYINDSTLIEINKLLEKNKLLERSKILEKNKLLEII